MMEGPWRRFREKHEPVSDIDTVLVDSLKALDPKRPIREADMSASGVRRERRRFPVGASPTRQPLQPEATGAVMEVTKWLKPSD